jgi:hypothetical protein
VRYELDRTLYSCEYIRWEAPMSLFGAVLGISYGLVIAAFINFTKIGRWMAGQMSWLLYTYSAAGGILVMLLLADAEGQLYWRDMACFIGASLIAIQPLGIKSLYDMFREMLGDANKDEDTEQDTVVYHEYTRER